MEKQDSNEEYRPIKSDVYDQLENAVTLRHICEIRYRDERGQERTVTSPIKDVYTDDGIVYARLDHFQTISLDQIVRVNEQTANNVGR